LYGAAVARCCGCSVLFAVCTFGREVDLFRHGDWLVEVVLNRS
jgi:hypothetical protein